MTLSGRHSMDMSEASRRVLRRRRQLIAACVNVDEALVDRLEVARVITEQQAVTLRAADLTANDRTMRLVEFLIDSPDFNLGIFSQCVDNCPSLVEELQADLRAEVGALEIEDHVKREAASMVHKQFGTSRRFSESDKRQIASMIAYKSQIAKETCRRHVISLASELETVKVEQQSLAARVKQLNIKVDLFIRQNNLDSVDKYFDLRTTTDVLKDSQDPESADAMTQLENCTCLLMNKLIRVTVERDNLAKKQRESKGWGCERNRRSGVVDDDHVARPLLWFSDVQRNPSDTEKQMATALKAMKKRTTVLEEEVNVRDDEIETLREQLRQLQQLPQGRCSEDVDPRVQLRVSQSSTRI
ncbi:hypothetical protein CAPTEDRAFT_185469 [Capitella teleta]|uniref:CARD domain-containing protein n=1 Tax=Capitella teleta TaxID=283909 RepID=R7VD57_CAPTE|nr:hypothetical protein CAPTEDRAFT_185469 [Capitella teleta]|eukprot:ELU16507.1 hypothetical protein CAPTEDRAFT_185469 [Capitella teleta]